ncbi:MAG: winged helix-turn-helix domain-containing protein [Ilumatobacteraceae bacterium]
MLIDAEPHRALPSPEALRLGVSERAVLRTLVESAGRVLSRAELARRSGLTDLHTRRCDAVIVNIRRALGPESIRTVRSRGWMLQREVVDEAESLLDLAS